MPISPPTPRRRRISSWAEAFKPSTRVELMPNCSARTSAWIVQRTTSAHAGSPRRTAGPSIVMRQRFGQDMMLAGSREARSQCREHRRVGAQHLAAAARVRLHHLFPFLDHHRLVADALRLEIGGERLDRFGIGADADSGAGKFAGTGHALRPLDEKRGRVMKEDAGKPQPETRLAREADRRRRRQHIDLTRLDRRRRCRRCDHQRLDGIRLAEHGRRQRAAEVDVEAGPHAARIDHRETRRRARETADDVAARLDAFERRGGAECGRAIPAQ